MVDQRTTLLLVGVGQMPPHFLPGGQGHLRGWQGIARLQRDRGRPTQRGRLELVTVGRYQRPQTLFDQLRERTDRRGVLGVGRRGRLTACLRDHGIEVDGCADAHQCT